MHNKLATKTKHNLPIQLISTSSLTLIMLTIALILKINRIFKIKEKEVSFKLKIFKRKR